jgi:hypothetical protein
MPGHSLLARADPALQSKTEQAGADDTPMIWIAACPAPRQPGQAVAVPSSTCSIIICTISTCTTDSA